MPSSTYILVTGANAGLGFAICCRTIDEFLSTRQDSSILYLIPTTRTQSKADATVTRLRAHLAKSCRAVEERKPGSSQLLQKRIVIEPELLDLSNILSVQRASKRLRQKYDKLDVMILNAGIGGWTGVDWVAATKQFFTEGINFIHKPNYKIGDFGKVSPSQLPQKSDIQAQESSDSVGDAKKEPDLGAVFTANAFGHYLLVHYLAPLLNRAAGQEPSRVIWVTSLEAYGTSLDMEDMQGLKSRIAYESSKRLTDVLAITADTTATTPYTSTFFGSTRNSAVPSSTTLKEADDRRASLRASTRARSSTPDGRASSRTDSPQRAPTSTNALTTPLMYTAEPGMMQTEIMDVPPWLIPAWILLFYIARFLGSSYHNIWPYVGAISMSWLALAPKDQLDAFAGGDSTSIKYGSATNWRGDERVRRVEVDWLYDSKGVSEGEEKRERFLSQGRDIWRSMEELRKEWEQRLIEAGHDEGLS